MVHLLGACDIDGGFLVGCAWGFRGLRGNREGPEG
jgi:hypothetical protein